MGVGRLFDPCTVEAVRGERARVVTVDGDDDAAVAAAARAAPLAWPCLRDGLDAAATVTEQATVDAVRDLTGLGVASGPCGAAGLAGLRGLVGLRSEFRDAAVVVISTEGPRGS